MSEFNAYKTMTLSDGCFYAGNTLAGKACGKGIGVWPDGTRYVGNWLNGLMHGPGRLYRLNGDVVTGVWFEGELIHKTTNDSPLSPMYDHSSHVPAQAPLPSSSLTRNIALIIGNCDYVCTPLNNCVSDSKLLANKLGELGFDVFTLYNATKAQMDSAIYRLINESDKYDNLLFFFSGHGFECNGVNYLLPIESGIESQDPDEIFTNVNQIMNSLDKQFHLKMYILDCCRSNPFKTVSFKSFNPNNTPTYAEGNLIAYATSPGQVASDGLGLSPYMEAMLYYLNQPNIPIMNFFHLVCQRVITETNHNQKPWFSGCIFGDFFFNMKP